MTLFDGKRLTNAAFQMDLEKLRQGFYADKYLANVVTILDGLQRDGYGFSGNSPRDVGVDSAGIDVGNVVVEAQIFNRREPYALVAGVDVALAMIRHAAGYYEGEHFVEAWPNLEVVAVQDGVITHYEGAPDQVEPVIEIRGRYIDFTLLETPVLGVLSRASRVATNVYEVMKAAAGKPVLFMPARYDMPEVQSVDGYAYWLAVQRYNYDSGHNVRALVSTDAQAAWWYARGGGTVPHALIACFMADTAEAMRAFARHIPVDVPRISLVDFNNDTVGASLATLEAFWPQYRAALEVGDEIEQKRWTLNGVRLDTGGNMLDVALNEGDQRGVSPLLVRTVRQALNNAWTSWDLPPSLEDAAREYCANVQIVVSGGFNRDRIARFERDNVPVDVYGVGSSLFANDKASNTDYTMDVVRVRIGDNWVDMAKTGRQPCDNIDLETVNLAEM